MHDGGASVTRSVAHLRMDGDEVAISSARRCSDVCPDAAGRQVHCGHQRLSARGEVWIVVAKPAAAVVPKRVACMAQGRELQKGNDEVLLRLMMYCL
jgi:hypothetical protein